VQLAGRDITNLAPERRGIGVVFQHAALFPHLSARDNIRFALKARGDKHQQPVDELLDRFGLAAHADRRPRSFSGGERQRVALARALAADPDLLLLDEPLSALDQPTREELRGALQNLLFDLGIPTIHVTHDRDEALTLADHVAVIVHGQLRQLQPANEIASCPSDADVARLLGWSELGQAMIDHGKIALGDLQLPTADRSGTAVVFYRPESVILRAIEPTNSASAQLRRTVAQIRPTLPLARVLMAGDPPLTALLLHRDLTRLDLHTGQQVEVQLPTEAVKTFTRTTATDDAGDD
jgi:ABC-type Fe3+/spermidine/putrescine transport system ATPase subunit